MTSHRGSDGLKDTVFHAIKGFPDRVSMSPGHRPPQRSMSYRTTAESRPPPPQKLIRAKEAGSFTSLSMKDTEPWDENYSTLSSRRGIAKSVSYFEGINESKDVSIKSIRASSAVNVTSVPRIIVTPAEVEPQPKIIKAPAAKDVKGISKETRAEWVHACRKGLVTKCQEMLNEKPELANYTPPYYYGYAAVHMATVGKWGKLLELLYQQEADINAQTSSGNTALHLAAQNNDKDTIRLLIRLGANPNLRDLQGQPYKFYLKEDDLSSSADIILRDNNNKTFRPRPASQGSLETIKEDRSFLRNNGSFREAMKKFIRSNSPAPRS